MLNRLLDPQNICLDANLMCLGAMVSKLQPSKYFLYFWWRPFQKVGKNHISPARIPWGFLGWTLGPLGTDNCMNLFACNFV